MATTGVVALAEATKWTAVVFVEFGAGDETVTPEVKGAEAATGAAATVTAAVA
jgi:hypothetical protein